MTESECVTKHPDSHRNTQTKYIISCISINKNFQCQRPDSLSILIHTHTHTRAQSEAHLTNMFWIQLLLLSIYESQWKCGIKTPLFNENKGLAGIQCSFNISTVYALNSFSSVFFSHFYLLYFDCSFVCVHMNLYLYLYICTLCCCCCSSFFCVFLYKYGTQCMNIKSNKILAIVRTA